MSTAGYYELLLTSFSNCHALQIFRYPASFQKPSAMYVLWLLLHALFQPVEDVRVLEVCDIYRAGEI